MASDNEDFYDDPYSKEIKKKKKEVEDFESNNKSSGCSYQTRILMSNMDVKIKSDVLKRFQEISFTESSKYFNWVNNLLKIPFGKYSPEITSDPYKFLKRAKKKLDSIIYSQDEPKKNILDFCCKIVCNPKSKGCVLALQSDPGTGKTVLIREGLSKILNRPFHTINFGGLTDSNTLIGHDYTYNGAIYGRLCQILIDSGVMDPIIYLDEIDKISGVKASEIWGVLTHILDESQNSFFTDNYFQGVYIDLSRILFVISFNDTSKIDKVVLDRIKLVEMDDLKFEEKYHITKEFMLPQILKENGFFKNELTIDETLINFIIDYNSENKGMRQIKKTTENIIERIRHLVCLKELELPLLVKKDLVLNIIKFKNKNKHENFMYT